MRGPDLCARDRPTEAKPLLWCIHYRRNLRHHRPFINSSIAHLFEYHHLFNHLFIHLLNYHHIIIIYIIITVIMITIIIIIHFIIIYLLLLSSPLSYYFIISISLF